MNFLKKFDMLITLSVATEEEQLEEFLCLSSSRVQLLDGISVNFFKEETLMKKLNQNSLLSFSFIFVLILTFTAGRFATAQDGSALEIDEFISSVEIELGGELILLSGPLTLHVHFESQRDGDANDDDKDGLDEVSTEIVAMELKGSSPTLGEVILRVNPNVPSLGQITEQANNTPGMLDLPPFSPGTADSFFDVFFEIELPSAGQSYTTLDPMRLRGVVTHKPAAPCDSFESQDEIEIFDADGNATGYFLRVRRLEGLCDDECDWNPDDGHKMHWPQLPDLGTSGIDVDMSQFFFADDFMCRATGSIDDIHFWGSFRDDVLPPNGPDSMIFEITIYSERTVGACREICSGAENSAPVSIQFASLMTVRKAGTTRRKSFIYLTITCKPTNIISVSKKVPSSSRKELSTGLALRNSDLTMQIIDSDGKQLFMNSDGMTRLFSSLMINLFRSQ